jgi:hypothetical protein
MSGWIMPFVDAVVSFTYTGSIQDDDASYWSATSASTLSR